ncbi:hypothetical protein BOX15_Mlig016925g1 [Macrostomum lignano]|uniref:Uncharacterized protein n=2 Tax=Macrostomum lignano TaxID=282301 RepID=A0A267GUY1_9PLAT|nr:hypothetical protein BOX15_Mlig018871g1 [Macrostomum lignano]PAA89102.1 hypothetical protein BOX15_Mlig016925g1 [Macrostomum lignano]
MATYLNLDVVHYICSCKVSKPLCRLYLCKHCFELRCQDCVLPEVDCQYCPNCLDYMSSGEAKVKKNRCSACYDCPSCGHTLSTRATSATLPSPDDPTKQVAQKVYYLLCAFCRWTTRDGGIPDQRAPSVPWRNLAQGAELRQDNSKRLTTLTEAFRQLALKEKAEKERKKIAVRKKSFFSPGLTDRYGLASVALRKKSLANPSHFTPQTVDIPEAQATEDPPDDLDEAYWLPPVPEQSPLAPGLHTRSSLLQRLADPEIQPERSSQLAPISKPVLCKRSLRCRQCDHNLSKPELNPAAPKFKINLCALYNVPEMRLYSVGDGEGGEGDDCCQLTLLLTNPASKPTGVRLRCLDSRLALPDREFSLGPCGDAALDLDDPLAAAGAQSPSSEPDRPDEVAFRGPGRLGLLARLRCARQLAAREGVRLELSYEFRNIVLPSAAAGESVEVRRLTAELLLRPPASSGAAAKA